jgi:hypothetical protein
MKSLCGRAFFAIKSPSRGHRRTGTFARDAKTIAVPFSGHPGLKVLKSRGAQKKGDCQNSANDKNS